MLVSTFLWTICIVPIIQAIPVDTSPALSLQTRCSNVLRNPSFESGDAPWVVLALGSWEQRGIYTSPEGGHHGRNFFYAHSNATIAETSINLSQSILSEISSGATVECSAWVSSQRPGNKGNTRVHVFVNELQCGDAAYLGTSGWIKAGGKVRVGPGPYTFSVVVFSDESGPEGSTVWVDDAWVGIGC